MTAPIPPALGARQAGDSSWFNVTSPRARHARWRLFCLPYAGGSANAFRHWGRHLPADVELVCVQYPGREDRAGEPLPISLQALASALADAMSSRFDDRPLAVFGHSLGALVAFELCRELRRRGALPLHLFVSGACGPRINAHAASPRHLWPESEFVEELERMGGTPPELLRERELMRFLLPTLRHDLGLVDTYACVDEAPLPIPIDAIGGLDDGQVERHELAEWAREAGAGFRMTMFAGDHFFLQPMMALICDLIAERIGHAPVPTECTA
jgi:medium-chain acyl-[acyl-carrier-protein] hydrolase